ncbi:MAG: hypothetical protein IJQ77_07505 [Synergistaceae bacterium]|nr:hypothetical protein [Synergistaceae bacterium]MBQ4469273.1 hypothetical protein [Synergistaceae bacterium]MBR0250913.1 hypothetical protein [Synergistaceae bacterium]
MSEREKYIEGIRKELKEAFETLDSIHKKLCNITELAYGLHNLEAEHE